MILTRRGRILRDILLSTGFLLALLFAMGLAGAIEGMK